MDDHSSSCLSCELKIIKAKNIDKKSAAKGGGVLLFVLEFEFHRHPFKNISSAKASNVIRLHLRALKLESMTSSPPLLTSDTTTTTTVAWNETFSLDCSGSKESIERLRQETLVLELRRRSTAPFVGRLRGSKLVGKAEIPWRTFLPADSTESTEIEKWIPMLPENGGVNVVNYGDKLPAVQIAMEINRRTERKKISGACGCVDGGFLYGVLIEYFT
ncbi:hypothetical protein ACP275_08G241700 [Erythranthe tilingii]